MRMFSLIIFGLILSSQAQLVVNDPVHTAETILSEVERKIDATESLYELTKQTYELVR